VFCQLLFNLLDDRTDAAFRQQLEDADFDLDIWLERESQASLRPVSFDPFIHASTDAHIFALVTQSLLTLYT